MSSKCKTCPYCKTVSLDRVAHKRHLSEHHPDLYYNQTSLAFVGLSTLPKDISSFNSATLAFDGKFYLVNDGVTKMIREVLRTQGEGVSAITREEFDVHNSTIFDDSVEVVRSSDLSASFMDIRPRKPLAHYNNKDVALPAIYQQAICKNCYFYVERNARFCSNCGAKYVFNLDV